MVLLNSISSYIFSLFVTIAIYIDFAGKFDKNSWQARLYRWMLITNMILLVFAPIAVIFDGLPGTINGIINAYSNCFLYFATTAMISLWVLYVDYQVYRNRVQLKKYFLPLACIVGLDLLLSFVSYFTGWYYILDANNIYQRSFLYPIHVLLSYILVMYSFIFIILNRMRIKAIRKSDYFALIFFILFPAIFSAVQIMFLGVELIWNSITISLLVVYFNIQNRTMSIDYLTGAFNRKKLDNYVRDKVKDASPEKTFSAIMLDINDFKQINDGFGHNVGDEILKSTVKLLKKVIGYNDFIARFGGDEFVIVLNSSSAEELNATVSKIEYAVSQNNTGKQKLHNITFCMGYAIYDYASGMTAEAFINHIDMLMYQNKNKYKSKNK